MQRLNLSPIFSLNQFSDLIFEDKDCHILIPIKCQDKGIGTGLSKLRFDA